MGIYVDELAILAQLSDADLLDEINQRGIIHLLPQLSDADLLDEINQRGIMHLLPDEELSKLHELWRYKGTDAFLAYMKELIATRLGKVV